MRTIVLSTLLSSCLVLGSAAGAVAESWRVVEGGQGATQGMWDVTWSGANANGNADMFDARGQKLSYLVTGSLADGTYTFERTVASDGSMCRYTGARRGDGKIAGTSECPDGLGVWIADTAWQ